METRGKWTAPGLAFVAGGVHWAVCSAIVGGEAWDGGAYWVTLPVLGLACAALGAWAPRRPWPLGASAAAAQAFGLFLTAGDGWALLPVGIALLAVLGAGLGVCARAGAWLAARIRPNDA